MSGSTVKLQANDRLVSDAQPLPVKLDGATGTELLAQLTALNTATGTATDAAGDPTVIGLLKQIVINTTP
ncbi:MAG: hypothetical protein WC205_04265 [Opitutaceae bacterium]|jgi:hypothetical protein